MKKILNILLILLIFLIFPNQLIYAQDTPSESLTSQIPVTALFKVTCANYNAPVQHAIVIMTKKDTGEIVASALSDRFGEGSFSYGDAKIGDTYNISIDPFGNIAPDSSTSQEVFISQPIMASFSYPSFHFPKCPNLEDICHQSDGNIESACIIQPQCTLAYCGNKCIPIYADPNNCTETETKQSKEDYCHRFDGNIEFSCIVDPNCTLSCGNTCVPVDAPTGDCNYNTPQDQPNTPQTADRVYCSRWDGQSLKCNYENSGCVYFEDCNGTCWPQDTRKEIACFQSVNLTPFPQGTNNPNSYNESSYYPQQDSDNTPMSDSSNQRNVVAVYLSNYPDFRDSNDEGDNGSTTTAIPNIEGQAIDWIPSANNPNILYVRKVYSDQTVEDYQASIDPGSTIGLEGYIQVNVQNLP